ncbi:TlpA disulfide reductase family protein [Pedobacter sp. UBA5917]|jgi:thiol-disulfide isomerase/thioredoxin|uniref:TlpA disulfide reductase family protein n=1 Tax=Pedobacter sp. UBA5917 TaxID=1947061 RepID=UPI0025FAB650|nr:TlpA disulfide reductase family protein [Pedobacter sp. UBA5917]
MLNKIAFILLIALMLSNFVVILCVAQKTAPNKSFQISGELRGLSTKFLVLRFVDNRGKDITDTCYITDGKFVFRGNIEEPTLAMITGRVNTKNYDDPNTLRFFIEPKKISISIAEDNFNNAQTTGSATQTDIDLLNRQNSELLINLRKLSERRAAYSRSIRGSSDKDSISLLVKERELIHSELMAVSNKIRFNKIDFIKNHPKSYASPYLFSELINDHSIPISLIKSIYQGFDGNVKLSKLGQDNLLRINNRVTSDEMELVKNNFNLEKVTLKNELGEKIKLSNFLGKNLIIVDFWASWCVPCVKSSPHLKKIYNSYTENGLQVIAISIDKKYDDWISAIKKNGYDIFVNLRDIPDRLLTIEDLKNTDEIPLSRKWGVDYIPSIMLFDKNGSLISRFDKIDDHYKIIGLEEKIKEFYGK